MQALERMLLSLEGLSIGDAFGQCFFIDDADALRQIAARQLPAPPWTWTDDTEMSLSLVAQLRERGSIHQADLAKRFARGMQRPEHYGMGAYHLLRGIAEGRDWRALSQGAFRGKGSFGNGAAMRMAPLGAFFADEDLSLVARQAQLSAEVTHSHAEGVAGCVAVAVAAALLWRARTNFEGHTWLQAIHAHTPAGYTAQGIAAAIQLHDATTAAAAAALGNGADISAPDTVPFCLWCVAHFGNDFAELQWHTVSALGDRDTTCAIAGGLGALRVGPSGLPVEWRNAREPLRQL